jgi:hypothetical protein
MLMYTGNAIWTSKTFFFLCKYLNFGQKPRLGSGAEFTETLALDTNVNEY